MLTQSLNKYYSQGTVISQQSQSDRNLGFSQIPVEKDDSTGVPHQNVNAFHLFEAMEEYSEHKEKIMEMLEKVQDIKLANPFKKDAGKTYLWF